MGAGTYEDPQESPAEPEASLDNEEQEEQGEQGNESTDELNEEVTDALMPITIDVQSKEVIATHLQTPWAITKHGDTFYVTEREGTIAQIHNGEVVRQHVQLDEQVYAQSEGGLLGLALSPHFEQNKEAYVYHTYLKGSQVLNRVVLVKLVNNEWIEQQALLEEIPGAHIHNGGRLIIGPDNKLYVTTGDANVTQLSQDKHNLAGSILRMNLDGSIPDDNPYTDSYVYSYGHRNPQGLAWNDNGTILYSSEHGPTGHDEINTIGPGKNYGWPEIKGDEKAEGMEVPLFHSGENTWAPSGTAYLNDSLFVAGLVSQSLFQFDLNEGTYAVVYEGEGRIRDVFIAERFLYMITNNTDGRGNPRPTDDVLIRFDLD